MNVRNSLVHLDVSYNAIVAVPAEIGDLHQLEVLYLSENQLRALPRELAKLGGKLRELLVENDDLVAPGPEVVEQGKDAVLAWCASEGVPAAKMVG